MQVPPVLRAILPRGVEEEPRPVSETMTRHDTATRIVPFAGHEIIVDVDRRVTPIVVVNESVP